MNLGEFDLIKTYFSTQQCDAFDGVSLGIGDDCAILDVPDGYQLAVTTDSLVAGVHFFEGVDPYSLGYKSLAVNLSDIAAMGATPKWVSLAITLPSVDPQWLAEFTRGFFALANKHNVKLVGGDTTKGPLSITVCAKGVVKRGLALQRNSARVDDLIVVSGSLGDGGIGLDCKLNKLKISDQSPFIEALEKTEPRNELGNALVSLASSCIDISDGLLQDLAHILTASNCSAEIQVEKLPLSVAHKALVKQNIILEDDSLIYALNGGDDYELIFTISKNNLNKLISKLPKNSVPLTVIGHVTEKNHQQIKLLKNNNVFKVSQTGWDHFKD